MLQMSLSVQRIWRLNRPPQAETLPAHAVPLEELHLALTMIAVFLRVPFTWRGSP
jgi:hypothetical protein